MQVASMVETKCVVDNFKNSKSRILVTVLQFRSPTSTIIFISVGHQYSKDVTMIQNLSPTSKNRQANLSHQHHDGTNITMLPTSVSPSTILDNSYQ